MPELQGQAGVVAIEPESGDFFVGATLGKADAAAFAKYPDHWVYFVRLDNPSCDALPTGSALPSLVEWLDCKQAWGHRGGGTMWIFKVGVVGAGAMGGGIAQVVTFTGLPVVVKDIVQSQLDLAKQTVEGIYQARVDKGKMTPGQMQEKLSLIEYTLSYDGLADVDIVIEAVPEVMPIKQQVLRELDQVCMPDTILASNTSALSITEMGAATGRPHKVIGMHFFNPAHVMKLVEIIPGAQTDQDTIDTVEQFTQDLRKIPVIVKECPGFLVNRLLMPYLNEAVLAVEEGAAPSSRSTRRWGTMGLAGLWGPSSCMDMLGIDVCAHVGEYLYSQYGERVRPAKLYYKLVEKKRFGEKTGVGFYIYTAADAEPMEVLIQRLQEAGEVKTGTKFSVDRLIMPFLNEAAMCVAENIANVYDVDMACIAGIGMQVNKGGELVRMGPLEYMDEIGLDVVVAKLEALEQELGPRFHPTDILYQKVRAGEPGQEDGSRLPGVHVPEIGWNSLKGDNDGRVSVRQSCRRGPRRDHHDRPSAGQRLQHPDDAGSECRV